jgi:hypothetical protein
MLLYKYINNKVIETIILYDIKNNIHELNGVIIFKSKKVKINFKENSSF